MGARPLGGPPTTPGAAPDRLGARTVGAARSGLDLAPRALGIMRGHRSWRVFSCPSPASDCRQTFATLARGENPMQRTVTGLTILTLAMLLVASVPTSMRVVGLSGDVFAQEVVTRKEVTITKTVPPGPSDEEVITRKETITQEPV